MLAELPAKVGEVNVNDVLLADVVHAPHTIEETLPAEHDPGLFSDGEEEVELDRGQGDRLTTDRDTPSPRVDDEITAIENPAVALSAGRSRAAQQRLDSRDELARRARAARTA